MVKSTQGFIVSEVAQSSTARISFFEDYETPDKLSLNPPFSTVYVCQGMLPQQILYAELLRPKGGIYNG